MMMQNKGLALFAATALAGKFDVPIQRETDIQTPRTQLHANLQANHQAWLDSKIAEDDTFL